MRKGKTPHRAGSPSTTRMQASCEGERSRALFCLVVVSALLLSSLVAEVNIALAQEGLPDCTYMIPPETETVNGERNFAEVQPGDTLCLPAGTRDNLKLMNLHGTPEKPIIVRNADGVVEITGERFLTGGIGIINSSYIRVTGAGVTAQCGAEYAPEEQACGIDIHDAHKGIKITTTKGTVSNIEIDHVAVRDTNTVTKTRGIAIHPVEGQLISGIHFHHNYVANTLAEGIYIGTEPHGRPLSVLGKLENVEVNHNRIEHIGYDGIKIKVAVKNVKVHHNVILDVGLSRTASHEGGIKLAFSVGEYYNNFIVTDIEGIKMGRDLPGAVTRYFNNVVIGAQSGGITTSEENALIYNNTVVQSGEFGIAAKGKGSQIFNNIVVETSGPAIEGGKAEISNNLVGSISEAGFVDPAGNDYRLLPGSPAVDAGRTTGVFPTFDLDDQPRPEGSAIDLGAYESGSSSATQYLSVAPPAMRVPSAQPESGGAHHTYRPVNGR